MPYEGEFAKYESLRRIVQNPNVIAFLEQCETQQLIGDKNGPFLDVAIIERSDWLPEYVIAIDGSHVETPVRNGYPGAEVSYISVASVMLDIGSLRILDADRPVDPSAFNRLRQSEAIDAVFPGCNVAFKGGATPQDTLRHQFFSTLENNRLFTDGETVLETYEALIKLAKETGRFSCPSATCGDNNEKAQRGSQHYFCDCGKGYPLFSTDALRFHAGMATGGPNGAMFAEISQVLEHLWLLNLLRSLEKKGWLGSLKRMAFFMDGPLGIFGHPAWLSQAIKTELQRINHVSREQNGVDIVLLGIEKSGAFETHLQMLDIHENGEPGRFEPQSLFLLNDEYIKKKIQMSVPLDQDMTASDLKQYGIDTYYGRKFLYKTRTGALIVGVSPFLHDGDSDLGRAEPNQHPRLADALNLLDELVSVRYPNSIVPIIEAHAAAAIPLNLGQRVLEQIAQRLIT